MKKLTMRFMIATAALVVVAGVASAQTMTASIPFEFRAGGRVMAPGTYRIASSRVIGVPLFHLSNVHSGGSIVLLVQAPVDPRKEWAAGDLKLVFACTGGTCALAELWEGSGSPAYTFHGPKLDTDVTAVLREIPMHPGNGE